MEASPHELDTAIEDGAPVISDICEHFKWVLPGVQEILDDQPQLTCTADQVASACMFGEATLWVTDEGFVISTAEVDTFTGDRTFLVWMAWAKKRGDNCAKKYYKFFSEFAKADGFKQIEVRSAVAALMPKLVSEGWDIDTIVYTREL